MAVSRMNTINIIGQISELDDIIEVCSQSGVFEPEEASCFFRDHKKFIPLTEVNPYQKQLIQITDIINTSKYDLKKVKNHDFKTSDVQIEAFINRIVSEVGVLQTEREALFNEYKETKLQISQLEHFHGLSMSTDGIFDSKFIKIRFGRIPLESYERLKEYHDNPYVLFFPCSKDEFCYGMYVAPISKIREVDRIFASVYFERLRVPDLVGSPENTTDILKVNLAEKKRRLDEIEEKMENYWKSEYKMALKVYSYLLEKSFMFSLRKYAAVYIDNATTVFIYTGFVPSKSAHKLKEEVLERGNVEVEIDLPDKEAHVKTPTMLKNWGLFKPYEFYVEMFGVPAYSEIDPTLFVGITYTLLFGIMFADVGHGLVLSVIAYFMWKLRQMKIGPILMRCGIASAFFGVVFGSVFGYEHALDPFYKAVFGLSHKPIEVLDKESITTVLFAPIGIGMVLILLAMILNIYSGFKQKNYERSLFSNNGLAGFVFYASIVVAVAGVLLGKSLLTPLYLIVFMAVPLIVMMFKEILGKLIEKEKNPLPKKWGEFIIQNFFELFDYLISYASNTISFMRIGAFVLIHAIMMEVVFMMAEMVGGAGEIIIIIFGNIFVMGLEALLVSIQGLRLEFYEMFSRFFEGNGRPFKPINFSNESLNSGRKKS